VSLLGVVDAVLGLLGVPNPCVNIFLALIANGFNFESCKI